MWECPDFFALGDRHCLIYSTEDKVLWTTGRYDRNGHTYTAERTGVLDQGASYYAPKSFAAPGGRRILWGWLRETRPEAQFAAAGWSGCMSYPRLLTMGAQGQLEMQPAHEVEKLRGREQRATVAAGAPFRRKLDELRHELFVGLNLLSNTVASVRLTVGGQPAWEMTLDVPAKVVRSREIEFPFPGLPWPRPDLRMLLDGSVVEAFIGGREGLTSRVYGLKPGDTELEVSVTGKGHIELQTWPLSAISADRMTS
jgi:beta-fructofuranosidase